MGQGENWGNWQGNEGAIVWKHHDGRLAWCWHESWQAGRILLPSWPRGLISFWWVYRGRHKHRSCDLSGLKGYGPCLREGCWCCHRYKVPVVACWMYKKTTAPWSFIGNLISHSPFYSSLFLSFRHVFLPLNLWSWKSCALNDTSSFFKIFNKLLTSQ